MKNTENLNFDSYFENTSYQYHDAKFMITILESIFDTKFEDIKKAIDNTQIVVTKEQIIKFLDKKFEEEDSELKKRVETPKPKRPQNLIKLTIEDIEARTKEFCDELSARRYYSEPYSLEYFITHSNIVRNKILLLLSVIEKIGNKDTKSIQDLLTDLDIQLDANGNILEEDIIRLIAPTIYNIGKLNEKVAKANDLSTYLTFKMSKDDLYKDGWLEGEIYPSTSLQMKDLYYCHMKDYVPLSSSQRVKLREEQCRNINIMLKRLINL